MPGYFDKRLGEFRDKDGGNIMYVGTSNVVDLYISNENELLQAWAFFEGQGKSVRGWVNGNIVLTANREFFIDYATAQTKFFELRGIGVRPIVCSTFTLTVGRLYFENISISRTNASSMLFVREGTFTGDNVHWRYFNGRGKLLTPDANIEIIGNYVSGTGSIKLKNISHASGDSASANLTGDVQPFTILNSAAGAGGAGDNVYISIAEVQSISNYDVFSRVLLRSSVAVRYMVTGDETWYHDAAQSWPGAGNIAATAKILKTSSLDILKLADDLVPINTTMLLAITAGNQLVKTNIPAVTDNNIYWRYYKAFVTQAGTDAPTANVLNETESDSIGAGAWSYVGVGIFRNTNAGAFLDGFTVPFEEYFYTIQGYLLHLKWISANVMELRTYAAGAVWDSGTSAIIGTLANDILNNQYLSISVKQFIV